MTDDQGFDVSPTEIAAHSKKVQDTVDLLDNAVGAVHGRLGHMDFGFFGNLLGMSVWCNHVMESALAALTEARAAGDRHAQAVKTWAETHRVNEESVAALYGGAK